MQQNDFSEGEIPVRELTEAALASVYAGVGNRGPAIPTVKSKTVPGSQNNPAGQGNGFPDNPDSSTSDDLAGLKDLGNLIGLFGGLGQGNSQ